MDVSAGLWAATILGLLGIIVVDLIIVDRRPHAFTAKEATRWVIFYVILAMLFAGFVALTFGRQYGGEFLAGYITEYSLSVDNLFVFMIIISSFAVPEQHRHRVLSIGIVIALILRGHPDRARRGGDRAVRGDLLRVRGLPALDGHLRVAQRREEADPEGNALIRFVERHVPTTREYHGTKLTVRIDGQRLVTPMLLVMLAIGTTDLLFALDSIPAVFGLTEEPYLVFTANAFALMGLRQLYFMLHGLLDRLIYLSKGLAIILGFIAVKLLPARPARDDRPRRPRDLHGVVAGRDHRRADRDRDRQRRRRPPGPVVGRVEPGDAPRARGGRRRRRGPAGTCRRSASTGT